MTTTKILFISLALLFTSVKVCADLNSDVHHLQTRWAQVNYELQGDPQLEAFEQLIAEAESATELYSSRAEVWIWSGIIKSTYAGAKGGLGALKVAKASKKDLEKAMELDATALNGSAYTSLGTLYANVPGWPLGFGDTEKAEELLKQAIAIDPEGIDSNYFYGKFLLAEKRHPEARDYLLKAQKAAPRANRPLADAGRQKEIAAALAKVSQKLK